MSQSRRDFIKYVVVGSVAAGCPLNATLAAAPDSGASDSGAPEPIMDGEHFEVCHQVRDHHVFDLPAPTKKAAVVIIGGGVAGLSAGYFLGDKDWLLLEKEDHYGGNAYEEEYAGQPFATGSAYAYKGDDGDQLANALGLKLLPVDNPDPTIVNKTFVPDTWKAGLDQLPYPKDVIASFKKFRDAIMKLDLKKQMMELDAQPFTNFTAGYAPEVAMWWDGYGPSNWGATTEDTSAFVAVDSLQGLITGDDGKRVILPGGLGCITHRLVEIMLPKYKERMLGQATVVAVVPAADSVNVTYFRAGQLTTVNAKAVIMCAPKLIASRLISDIPAEQKAAMHHTRYAPYPVVNVIFDKPVYNRGYDTWCPGNSFTDMIVADWVVRNQPGYKQKFNILTCYAPLHEEDRPMLLSEPSARRVAAGVLHDFQKLMPEFNVDPIEVHLFRRGHPLYMSTPGLFTQTQPEVRQPMDRVFFANTDSEGPESTASAAIAAAQRAAKEVENRLAGKPMPKETAVVG